MGAVDMKVRKCGAIRWLSHLRKFKANPLDIILTRSTRLFQQQSTTVKSTKFNS